MPDYGPDRLRPVPELLNDDHTALRAAPMSRMTKWEIWNCLIVLGVPLGGDCTAWTRANLETKLRKNAEQQRQVAWFVDTSNRTLGPKSCTKARVALSVTSYYSSIAKFALAHRREFRAPLFHFNADRFRLSAFSIVACPHMRACF